MAMRRDDLDLTLELRALRPSPSATFTDELDAHVAAGFAESDKREEGLLGRIAHALRNSSPRRPALPAGAAAVTALVVATAVIAIGESDDTASLPHQVADTPGHSSERLTQTGAPPHAKASPQSSGAAAAAGPEASTGYQYSDAPPTVRHRDVARGAELVLRSGPGEIGDDAKQVFAAIHAARGIVLSSSIHDQAEGPASASFELLIPAARLSDTLASLSRIADVATRRESTLDITAPTVSARGRLKDSEATIDGMLTQLAIAESYGERSVLETQLRHERQHATTLRSQLDRLSQRADFARVSLRIESGESTGATSSRWGVGDALDDAGHILAIAAGVAVIGLAVLGPLVLIALIAWLVNRAWARRRRESVLR